MKFNPRPAATRPPIVKTLVRSTISLAIGFTIAALFAFAAVISESSEISLLRWLSDLFQLPGGVVLRWTHYGAPPRFQQLTHSEGPAAAYLWMMSVSFLVWLFIAGVATFLLLRRLRRRTI
jgi:hypothetical protein